MYMGEQDFEVERVFFEKYINELSSDAFKVLLKMLYLSRSTGNDVNVRSSRSLRRVVGLNTSYATSIWNELEEYGIITKRQRRNRKIYVLNGDKIKDDNSEYMKEKQAPRNISVTVFDIEKKITNVIELSDENLRDKVVSVMGQIDPELEQPLMTTIGLLKKYHIDREKRFRMSHLSELLVSLVKYDVDILKRVCQRYNTDSKIAGMRGFRYFLKMAEGMASDISKPRLEQQQLSEKIVKKRIEEGELKFAIKLASGKVSDSLIYKKLVKAGEVEKLNQLWRLGASALKETDNRDEINKNYDWLKL